jgi:class 3 adenylate cyclase
MKRRSEAGGHGAVPERRSVPKFKHRGAASASREAPSADPHQEEIVRLTRELEEARERQTATSEVLRALSQSDFQLQSVLQSVAESAARLCRSDGAVIFQLEDGVYRFAAGYSLLPEFLEIEQRAVILPGPGTLIGRAALTGNVVRIDDALIDPLYEKKEDAKVEGNRSMIGVPLVRGGEPVVVIGMGRRRVDPFGEHEIELAKSFAAQAVVAIENARLLNDLRQRTTDLTEALEQQTATSEVLQVIGGSPGDLQPVFQTMLANATRICEAKFGVLWLSEGDCFRCVALHNAPLSFADHYRDELLVQPPPGSGLRRLYETRQVAQVTDMTTIRPYIERDPFVVASVELGGYRSVLNVPILKESALVGAISIFRQEACPFNDKQIELVQSFAAQAVIAIENARLLDELRQRTADLGEALERQTASAEVLQVISSSAGELEPVFTTILEKAVTICDATFGSIYRWDGRSLHFVSTYNAPPNYTEARKRLATTVYPDDPMDRLLSTKSVVHIEDWATESSFIERHSPAMVLAVEEGGVRTGLLVPLLKDNEVIGSITLLRQRVQPFADKQIMLAQHFAAQAVIAIENARLLNELRDRTEEVEKLNEQLEQRVTDQVDEIERMGRLRRFLPPQVADLIVASGSEKQLESHRREITALFCDLRGFTGFTESADAEDVMALLRDYHAAIGEIIIKYNGTLERYAGDGVMVVFNDPVPVENPPLQAVLMALEVREAIGALTGKWRRFGHDIGFGIGIAHGYATLGTIGFEGRFDYAAIGTVSNVASRLCDEAKPGQILISPRVLVAVEDAVQVEPVGEFELKGIRRPLAAYNVVGSNT